MSEGEKKMQKTLLNAKVPAILLILMFVVVLPIQLRSASLTNPTSPSFYVVVDPDEGHPEIEVEVRGKLSADSEVDVKFGYDWDDDAPPNDDWDWYTYVLDDVETDEEGSFEAEFEVPSVSAGTYTVMAIDEEGEWTTDEFEVEPRIELTPDSGEPSEEITIEGWGFTEESDIMLTFDGEDVTPAGGIETDSDGRFKDEFEVPDVLDVDYTVTAEDEEELSAKEDFEVVTPPVPPDELTVEIHPETLNLKSNGKWITVYITFQNGVDIENIDVSKILLDDEISADTDPKYGFVKNSHIKDRNGNGTPDLMVKFDRAEIIEYIQNELEVTDGKVTLTITGEIEGETFEDADTIRMRSPGKGKGPKG